MRQPFHTIIVLILAAALVAGAILVLRGGLAVAHLSHHTPSSTPFMRTCHRPAVQQVVSLERISPALRRAVLIAEDPHFFDHPGIAWQSLVHAVIIDLGARRIVLGASSITMQTAKNIFLKPERTWQRKWNELWIAFAMEAMLSKERILELYLNVAEFAPRIYGAELGAQYYFGKPASKLGEQEAAQLASLLPNPKMITHPAYRARFAVAAIRIREQLHAHGLD